MWTYRDAWADDARIGNTGPNRENKTFSLPHHRVSNTDSLASASLGLHTILLFLWSDSFCELGTNLMHQICHGPVAESKRFLFSCYWYITTKHTCVIIQPSTACPPDVQEKAARYPWPRTEIADKTRASLIWIPRAFVPLFECRVKCGSPFEKASRCDAYYDI
jgi:hypothetical protein